MTRENTEDVIRDRLIALLFQRIGEPKTLQGQGAYARFNVRRDLGGGVCAAEGSLDYVLPDGTRCGHKNDVLVSSPSGKHIGIEIKFLSAVTDQFKTRSYDMLHLKNAHGENLTGMMVYLHAAGTGIGVERARSICYPYDLFFGLEFDSGSLETERWAEVLDAVESAIAGW